MRSEAGQRVQGALVCALLLSCLTACATAGFQTQRAAAPSGPVVLEPYVAPPVRRLSAETLRRWTAPEVSQGVAVDERSFYPLDNTVIARYDRETGELLARFVGPEDGLIRHLNSCLVLDSLVWCANSNYPLKPMGSSIEVFDAETLEHRFSHSLGMMDEGSLVWFDRLSDGWLVGFAHYDSPRGLDYKDSRFASVVTFDASWRRTGGWLFPDTVLDLFRPHAASGGALGPDGLLYVMGHDRPELYVLAQPTMGPTLVHVATIDIEAKGQAFSWAPGIERVIFAQNRSSQEVIEIQVPDVGPLPEGARRFGTR